MLARKERRLLLWACCYNYDGTVTPTQDDRQVDAATDATTNATANTTLGTDTDATTHDDRPVFERDRSHHATKQGR